MSVKYCPALVVMLRVVLDLKHRDIVAVTGYKSSAVGNIISRKCPECKHFQTEKHTRRGTTKEQLDISKIEREYVNGATTYELGEKYGVHHATISMWMRKSGHLRGKGYNARLSITKLNVVRHENALLKWKNIVLKQTNNTVALVELDESRIYLRCCVCGNEYTRAHGSKTFYCPVCEQERIAIKNLQKQADIERKKKEREEELLAEYQIDKHCAVCGCVFHSEVKTKKYCSDKCKQKAHNKQNDKRKKMAGCFYGNHRKRARKYGVEYEPGITLKKLIKRDNNICQICGKPCDINDLSWGSSGPMHPTIDHIVAMANGGGHTWENIQLAHAICNSYKRDLKEDEFLVEVIPHA